MELTGRIKGLVKDYITGKYNITFEVNETSKVIGEYDTLKDYLLNLNVKKHRKRRSLDANAYYWALLTKLAGKVKASNNFIHNTMLRQYGQVEIIGDQAVYVVIPDTDEAAGVIDEEETYHLKPTSQVKAGKGGVNYRTYMLLRGSSSYNTAEMSRLIEGLIQECKGQGIETLTPEEFERMMQDYGKKHTTAT